MDGRLLNRLEGLEEQPSGLTRGSPPHPPRPFSRAKALGAKGGPSISVRLYDLPERQVDSFADREFGFRNRVLPVLLHRSGHND